MTVDVLRLGGTLVWDSEMINLQTVLQNLAWDPTWACGIPGVDSFTFAVNKLMTRGLSGKGSGSWRLRSRHRRHSGSFRSSYSQWCIWCPSTYSVDLKFILRAYVDYSLVISTVSFLLVALRKEKICRRLHAEPVQSSVLHNTVPRVLKCTLFSRRLRGTTTFLWDWLPLFFSFCEDRGKQPETLFMSQEDLVSVLRERVSDCPEEILCELAEHLVR